MSEKMEQTEHYLLGKMCSGDQDCKHECPCTAEELAALRATVARMTEALREIDNLLTGKLPVTHQAKEIAAAALGEERVK